MEESKLELLLCVTGLGEVMMDMGKIPEQRFGSKSLELGSFESGLSNGS